MASFLPGYLADIMGGEGAGREEVVAAAALEAADQLTHVRRVVVLRRAGRAQLRRPKTTELYVNRESLKGGPQVL